MVTEPADPDTGAVGDIIDPDGGEDFSALHLSRLTWLDARSRVITSTTALPRYGYVQFQP